MVCFSILMVESTMDKSLNLLSKELVNVLMDLVVSKKDSGIKINLMVQTAESMTLKLEKCTQDQWKMTRGMEKEDFMMLNVMKYILVTLR